MSTPLTPEFLAELRELERRATPIPWRPKSDGIEYEGETVLKGDLRPIDECFVAAMRNALPALLDAAEELERVKTSNSAVFDLAAYIKDGIAKQEEEQARMFGISKVEATK